MLGELDYSAQDVALASAMPTQLLGFNTIRLGDSSTTTHTNCLSTHREGQRCKATIINQYFVQGHECEAAVSLSPKRPIGKQTALDDRYCTTCTAADSYKRGTHNGIHPIHRPLHFSFPRSWSLTRPRCFKRRTRSNS